MLGGGGRVGSAWYELELRDEGFLGSLQNTGRAGAGALGPAEDAAAGIGGKLDEAGAASGRLGGSMGKLGAIGQGAIMGIAGAVTTFGIGLASQGISSIVEGIGNSIELSSNKAESASKANELFGQSYGIIEEASKSAADTVALSSGAYLELAGNLGNLVVNMGITGDAGANMSKDMIQLAADMGSFNNASTTDVTEAMGAAFRGETEPIRRFGVMLDASAVAAKAVELGLADSTKSVSTAARAQATYALIVEQTSHAQGDLARTADGLANSQRLAAARQEEAWTKLGDSIKPLAEKIMPMLADAGTAIVQGVSAVVDAVIGWVDANQPLIHQIEELVNNYLHWLFDAWKTIFDVLGDLWHLVEGPVTTAFDILGKAIGAIASVVGIFIEGLGNLGNALNDLHRFMDPNFAAMDDLHKKFVETGLAAGLTADQIDDAWKKAQESAQQGGAASTQSMDQWIASYKDAIPVAADFEETTQESAAAMDAMTLAAGGYAATAGQVKEAAIATAEALGAQNTQVQLSAEQWQTFQKTVDDALVALGPTFDMTDEAVAALAARFGTDGETIRAEWQSVAADTEAMTKRISDHLATLPAGFQLTSEAADQMATLLGVKADDVVRTFAGMGGDVTKIAGAIPGQIGHALTANAGAMLDDADKLKQMLEAELKPGVDATKAIGADFMKLLRQGFASERPETVDQARQTALDAIAAISQAGFTGAKGQKGLKDIGIYYDQLLASGMTAEQVKTGLIAGGVAASVVAKLGGATAAASTQGSNIAAAWVTGLVAKLNSDATAGRIGDAAARAARDMKGQSPPKTGPLRFIGQWATNVAEAWIDPLVSRLERGADEVGGALSAYRFTADGLGGMTSAFSGDVGGTIRVVHELDLRNAPAGITEEGVAGILGPTMNAELYLRNLDQSALLPARVGS